MLLRIGAGLHQLPQCLSLLHRQLRPTTYRFDINEPSRALFIEAMRPVPQRLAIHAANLGRRCPIHPSVDRSQRQQPSSLIRVLRLPSQAAKIRRCKIIPKTNCCAHLLPPNQTVKAK
jgi:hypothetical protein